jgi:hypothetical protein
VMMARSLPLFWRCGWEIGARIWDRRREKKGIRTRLNEMRIAIISASRPSEIILLAINFWQTGSPAARTVSFAGDGPIPFDNRTEQPPARPHRSD